jgi:predicted DNA-binding protein with PD1-like motif
VIFQETTRTRRLVGRIEQGEDLVEALTELCRDHDVHAGQIQAIGSLSHAEVARFSPSASTYETIFDAEGDFELISLSGNVSQLGDQIVLRLEVLLSAMGPAGPQVLSGQLRSAKTISCEFVLEVFEDLAVERRLDPDTGRLTVKAIRRTQEPAKPEDTPSAEKPEQAKPIAGKGMSWKDAVGESQDVAGGSAERASAAGAGADKERSAEDIYAGVNLEEPLMEAGDILEHPKLGNCRVMKIEEGEFAHVRLPRGRIRKLSLDIVDVEFDRQEDGRRVFKARVGR